jgi:hypothetical protein
VPLGAGPGCGKRPSRSARRPARLRASLDSAEMPRQERQPHVEFSVLVDGFTSAQGRFAAAALAHNQDDSFHALFEMLAWVGAIRDRFKEEGTPIPPVLDGLYYVRNLVIHQGADVVEWIFSLTSAAIGASPIGAAPLGGGAAASSQAWPAREKLPRPRSMTGAEAYEKLVAGHEVMVPLRNLAKEFI